MWTIIKITKIDIHKAVLNDDEQEVAGPFIFRKLLRECLKF